MSVSAETTPYPLLPLLGRGLGAGALAGLASGLFSLLLAEPLMDRAIRLEEKRSAAAQSGHHHAAEAEEVFTRGTQHFGLVVTAAVVGLAVGVFFTLAYVLVYRSAPMADGRAWQRGLGLAGAGFLALSLLPGLRYPANPPGVGDSGTVTERQGLWVAALVISVLGLVLARQFHVRLGRAGHGLPARQSAAAATVVATLAALFLLPDNPDAVPVSATLLWDFRVLSFAAHAVLWTALGTLFALLCGRLARGAGAGERTDGGPSA
ncbi:MULTISPECIES: CbtA family protein [unclassified Streptomyces]|uniref:CbtA family protein n=1 Tax=unclassified Streptomyces TaxID=2593676 RepID=UPI002DD8CFFB|nr:MULTISPECIES: CbtA family protein [unclassified Streptomyces]WSA94518.1 CbtA family protein [Streptomyces sp. NBC_01795]WSB78937.1 CbtA family protein [Streptomyces sp. NBC_01775]WSS12861.1 CbtA family protein [Streptomyces sp. NBC_01186]WSS41645.1 CbtA family protein [Streptomyces sp. NBC_01187]